MNAYTVVGAILILAAGERGLAQAVGNTESTQEVLAAEDARFVAMTSADTAALAGMLADDLVYVHSSGRVETKNEFIRAVGSGAIRYLAFLPADRHVTFLDTRAAIIMGRANARVIFGGQELSFEVRYIGVYVRTADRWQLRAWQTTRTAPPS